MEKDATIDNLISELLELYSLVWQETETDETHKFNDDFEAA